MKVAQLTLSVSHEGGGVSDCVRALTLRLQAKQGMEPEVLGLEDEHTADDLPGWKGLPVHVFPRRYGFTAPGMAETLQRLDVPLAHTHGLWSCCSLIVHRWSCQTGRPYVVSPHGMLDAWALQNSRWKKQIAAHFFERRHLENAACLHAVCAAEVEAIRAYGLRNPVCVIPNGVDLPSEPGKTAPDELNHDMQRGERTVLFLGRLHPKKGLVNLLRSWSRVVAQAPALTKHWRLQIAGWDQGGHVQELRRLARELRLESVIEFVGPLYGEAKASAFRQADAFVLPSFSEGLPLSVLEAWSYRLPVLMTPECNIPEGFTADAAVRASPDPHSLGEALETLFRMSDAERAAMGKKGRALVERDFTWSRVASQMREVYSWLVEEGAWPGCVVS